MLVAFAVVAVALGMTPVAGAQDAEEELAGYVGMASGAAFSLQPIFPGLLPTGDAPFEVTGGLTAANVKSGGNAYGQAAALWPGSAAANLGPLLGTAAGQPIFTELIPPYPLAVDANQDEGEQSQGAPPGPLLRAKGEAGASDATSSAGGLDVPGIVHADAVTSTSRTAVEGRLLISEAAVTLTGVVLGDGAVTIDSLKTVARATSDGDHSTSTGSTVLSGLEIAGRAAELSEKGLTSAGLPVAILEKALDDAGLTVSITEAGGSADGGSADRVSSGLVVTLVNPAAAANPQFEGSKFVLLLGPTAVGALASPPFDFEFVDQLPLAGVDSGGGFSTVASTVTDTFAGGGTPAGTATPIAFEPARRVLDGVGGVSAGLLLGLLLVTVLGARWLSRYVRRLVSIEE
ncbi:MAG: hypothetical protein JWN29_3864 [Acidimicrobiales bacterium]|nr:hypothetical protein [Acidimicrobiales bacterium]